MRGMGSEEAFLQFGRSGEALKDVGSGQNRASRAHATGGGSLSSGEASAVWRGGAGGGGSMPARLARKRDWAGTRGRRQGSPSLEGPHVRRARARLQRGHATASWRGTPCGPQPAGAELQTASVWCKRQGFRPTATKGIGGFLTEGIAMVTGREVPIGLLEPREEASRKLSLRKACSVPCRVQGAREGLHLAGGSSR